jgi:hypothetical protein
VLYFLANLDFEESRWAEAAAGYRHALSAEDAPPPAPLLAIVAEHRAGASDAQSAAAVAALAAERPDDPALRYAQIRLLALARDPAVRDPQRALELGQLLAFQQPSPQALRTLALSQAAAGDFDSAAANQSQALALSGGWLPADMQEAMDLELSAYRKHQMEGDPWPAGDPLIAPPPFDATGPFRDYPASVPY